MVLANTTRVADRNMLDRLQDVFAALERQDVRYVIIGETAAVLHGVPRATYDLDILIEATSDNARRLLEALLEAKLGTASLIGADELLAKEITVFSDRVRVEVQTGTPGLTFRTAWTRRVTMNHRGQSFFVVSRRDLVASKRASGLEVDLEDARLLEPAAARR